MAEALAAAVAAGVPVTDVDVAVVGSGPGGAVAATLLAEGGKRVVLIEEGGYAPQDVIEPFGLAEMVARYRRGGMTVAMGPTPVNYAEGCCLGGGSEVNGGIYHRLPDAVIDSWAAGWQVRDFTPASMAPLFEANEQDLNVGQVPSAPASGLLEDGAKALGWSVVHPPRWYVPAADYDPRAPVGVRQSMTETLLPRFVAAGGMVVTGCRVTRVRRGPKGWIVHGQRNGVDVALDARITVVAGGTIQSPALLRRSGVGRNVGNTLSLHTVSRLVAEFDDEVGSSHGSVGTHQVDEFMPRFKLGCSILSRPHLMAACTANTGWVDDFDDCWQRRMIYYVAADGGQGKVRNLPGGELAFYRTSAQERANHGEGLRALAKVALRAGARRVLPVFNGAAEITDYNGIDRLIPASLPGKQALLHAVHISSSCPMGEDRERCAADSVGRVHDASDLYLADASLFCDAPTVNPQSTVMALARRTAAAILGEGR